MSKIREKFNDRIAAARSPAELDALRSEIRTHTHELCDGHGNPDNCRKGARTRWQNLIDRRREELTKAPTMAVQRQVSGLRFVPPASVAPGFAVTFAGVVVVAAVLIYLVTHYG